MRRLVVELLVHFLADPAPVLRGLFDDLRLNDLFDDGQVFRNTLGALALGLARGGGFHGHDVGRSLLLFRGGALFSRLAQAQQQFQLLGIELLAGGTENALDEQIDFLAQKRVLLLEHRDLFVAICNRLQQLVFTGVCHR